MEGMEFLPYLETDHLATLMWAYGQIKVIPTEADVLQCYTETILSRIKNSKENRVGISPSRLLQICMGASGLIQKSLETKHFCELKRQQLRNFVDEDLELEPFEGDASMFQDKKHTQISRQQAELQEFSQTLQDDFNVPKELVLPLKPTQELSKQGEAPILLQGNIKSLDELYELGVKQDQKEEAKHYNVVIQKFVYLKSFLDELSLPLLALIQKGAYSLQDLAKISWAYTEATSFPSTLQRSISQHIIRVYNQQDDWREDRNIIQQDKDNKKVATQSHLSVHKGIDNNSHKPTTDSTFHKLNNDSTNGNTFMDVSNDRKDDSKSDQRPDLSASQPTIIQFPLKDILQKPSIDKQPNSSETSLLNARDLSMLFVAFSKAEDKISYQLIQILTQGVTKELPNLNSTQLVNILRAYSIFDVEQENAFLMQSFRYIKDSIHELDNNLLIKLLDSYSALKTYIPAMLQMCTAVLLWPGRINSLSIEQISRIMGAYQIFGYHNRLLIKYLCQQLNKKKDQPIYHKHIKRIGLTLATFRYKDKEVMQQLISGHKKLGTSQQVGIRDLVWSLAILEQMTPQNIKYLAQRIAEKQLSNKGDKWFYRVLQAQLLALVQNGFQFHKCNFKSLQTFKASLQEQLATDSSQKQRSIDEYIFLSSDLFRLGIDERKTGHKFTTPSNTQMVVFHQVKDIYGNGILEHCLYDGLILVDIYLEYQGYQIVIEVDGQFHYHINSPPYILNGQTIGRNRILEAFDFVLVCLPFYEISQELDKKNLKDYVAKMVDIAIYKYDRRNQSLKNKNT